MPEQVDHTRLESVRRATLLGLALIAALSIGGSHGQWGGDGPGLYPWGPLWLPYLPPHDVIAAWLGWALMGFLLWLVTGAFDGGCWGRRDGWMLGPLVVAVALRLGVAPRSLEEIELHLYDGKLPTLHSYVVPLLGRMLRVLPGDAHEHAFALAGWMGALAVVPIYRFVRDRTGSVEAGAVVAMAYACHPIAARFAPTDAPYGLMLLTFFHAIACLASPAPSVVAGAVSLALAISCRADGALLLPVALALVGPRTLRALWTQRRQEVALGAGGGAALALGSLAVVLPHHNLAGVTEYLSSPLKQLLSDVFASPGVAGMSGPVIVAHHAWQALVLVGALAGLVDRRLRWSLAAAVGAVWLSLPYHHITWTWPVALHRLVPTDALLALASGGALAWPVLWLRGRSLRSLAAVAACVGAIGLAVASVPLLTRPWVFNTEWEMVRSALAPGGVESPQCSVIAFSARSWDDMDVHDFGQMLFDTAVVGCWENDCVAVAKEPGCHRYVRGLRCYLAPDRLSGACADPALSADEALARCLAPECAAVEAALQLRPIQERTIRPGDSFGGTDERVRYPAAVKVGVYEVIGVKAP